MTDHQQTLLAAMLKISDHLTKAGSRQTCITLYVKGTNTVTVGPGEFQFSEGFFDL